MQLAYGKAFENLNNTSLVMSGIQLSKMVFMTIKSDVINKFVAPITTLFAGDTH